MSAPTASAVVVLHNSAEDLRRLLRSLERHLPDRLQLIVVDSGSEDDGAEVARDAGAEVVVLEQNLGFGAANNAGLTRAEGEVSILLNADTELLDDGLWRLVELAVEQWALLVPRLRGEDGRIERSAHPRPGRPAALLPALVHPRVLPRRARLRADPWRSERPRRVGWAIAACLVARTDVLRSLGPFDPEIFLFYEDMDLCLRAADADIPTVFHPEVEIIHRGGHSTRPAFGGEPFETLAEQRRKVVAARTGKRSLLWDDAAQAVTFATRTAARRIVRRDTRRETAQLHALLRARQTGPPADAGERS